MPTDATTAAEYLASLPDDRRAQVEPVYEAVRAAMPEGYEEAMSWGMITWQVPLATYPTTYNGEPLAYVSLAARKRHNALYLMGLYGDGERTTDFEARWTADGRPLDMGKSCLRYRAVDDLRLDLVTEAVAAVPAAEFVARYERSRS